MCQLFCMFCTKFWKQKETFVKCMCREMYISYIFVRIVIEPYFCHSYGRLLCIKMLHCVYLKNGVSGEVHIFIISYYILQHFQWIFIQIRWTSDFDTGNCLLLLLLYLELVLSVVVSHLFWWLNAHCSLH